jgi:hypothetical protein
MKKLINKEKKHKHINEPFSIDESKIPPTLPNSNYDCKVSHVNPVFRCSADDKACPNYREDIPFYEAEEDISVLCGDSLLFCGECNMQVECESCGGLTKIQNSRGNGEYVDWLDCDCGSLKTDIFREYS